MASPFRFAQYTLVPSTAIPNGSFCDDASVVGTPHPPIAHFFTEPSPSLHVCRVERDRHRALLRRREHRRAAQTTTDWTCIDGLSVEISPEHIDAVATPVGAVEPAESVGFCEHLRVRASRRRASRPRRTRRCPRRPPRTAAHPDRIDAHEPPVPMGHQQMGMNVRVDAPSEQAVSLAFGGH